jgi:hypothetical protein
LPNRHKALSSNSSTTKKINIWVLFLCMAVNISFLGWGIYVSSLHPLTLWFSFIFCSHTQACVLVGMVLGMECRVLYILREALYSWLSFPSLILDIFVRILHLVIFSIKSVSRL